MERGRASQFYRGKRGGRGATAKGKGRGQYEYEEVKQESNTQLNNVTYDMPKSAQYKYVAKNQHQKDSNILEETKMQLRGRGNNDGRGGANFINGRRSESNFDNDISQAQEGKNRARFFMNQELEQIRQLTGQQIAQKLLDYKDLSASFDATKYTVRGYSHLINIWHKLCYDKSIQSTQLNLISAGFMESKFFERLQNDYINDLNNNIRNLNDYKFRLDDLKLLLEIFMILIEKFQSKIQKIPIPVFASFIRDDVTLVQESCDILNIHGSQVKLLQEMATKLLEKRMIYLKASKEEEKKQEEKKKQMKGGNYKIKPQDSFQDIDVVPTSHELISGQQPFLRQMPAKGDFDDTHDYLDIVYRLLREDAIRPLREGIDVMKRQLRDAGVRLYESAYLQYLSFTRNSPDVAITLRIYEKGKSNWNASKRLLPGSLMILSKDNFKTLNFFLVCDRDAKQMAITSQKYNYVEIKVQHISNEISQKRVIEQFDSDESDDDQYMRQLYNEKESPVLDFYLQHKENQLKIIESTAYFESYNHVLKKLKQIDKWENVPFADYLTGQIKKDIKPPIIFQQLGNQNKRQTSIKTRLLL
ncbi:UNKNOWN [Stylonychia lemnae]|uniref:ZNFX1 domain-containing protein n=1 Tax=Stylonychia lemnae TaxID=5949 RepID=A0A077ZPM0_STYLE|nr:UNKNOWN [Stylonychia lemnae]|eukprot:CDW71409.1 UNKNOWN [Stylonychia lemnae]